MLVLELESVFQYESRPSGRVPFGVPMLGARYAMAFLFLRCCHSTEPTKPHHGSSVSNARLVFHTVGNLKSGSRTSIWQLAVAVQVPGAMSEDCRPGWTNGSAL